MKVLNTRQIESTDKSHDNGQNRFDRVQHSKPDIMWNKCCWKERLLKSDT